MKGGHDGANHYNTANENVAYQRFVITRGLCVCRNHLLIIKCKSTGATMDTMEARVLANLISLRKAAGLSQKQVEVNLGLRTNTLYDIEKGRLKLPFVLAVELVDQYHSDLNRLLLETSESSEDANSDKKPQVSPLMSLGVISGGSHPLTAAMSQDPVIVAEIGVGQLGKKPLMDLLLDNLTESQQRHFVVDLYRYINSLISSDGEIRQTELSIRDTLIAQSQITLTDSEKKSIARAFTKPYLGKSMTKSLPRDAYRHFLVWILHLVSRYEGRVHFKATEYIHKVAQHIELPVSALRYIEEQVAIIYQDDV
jgi:transcriptional regulator with XRE-family HTH domain